MDRSEYYSLRLDIDRSDICMCWTGMGMFIGDRCMTCGCDSYDAISNAVKNGYTTWERVKSEMAHD